MSKTFKKLRGNIIFGSYLQFSANPLGFLSNCACEHGDLVFGRFGTLPVIFLNHPSYVAEALIEKGENFRRKERFFRQGTKRLLGNGLFLSEGDFYKRQRQMSQPAFRKKILENYADTIVAEGHHLLETWKTGEIRDIYQDFISLTLSIVAKTFLDTTLEQDEAQKITAALDAAVIFFKAQQQTYFLIPEWFPLPRNIEYINKTRELKQAVAQIINRYRRRRKDNGNFLEVMLRVQEENPALMTETQMRDEVVNLFLAGHETTAIALTWTFYLLSQHPNVAEALQQELSSVLKGNLPTINDLPNLPYTEAIAREALRLYPPVWLLSREAVQDTEIGGKLVKKGDTIFACPWVIHRDSRFFPEPESFSPMRWLDDLINKLPSGAYFPFSLGGRSCLGKAFGMMETVLLLATIAQRFHLQLDSPHKIDFFLSLTLRPRHGMRMAIQKRVC